MSAPFRIKPRNEFRDGDNQGFKEYLGRLLKLIPAEVVGLYMIGSGFLSSTSNWLQLGWAAVCLVLVIVVRVYGTADPADNLPYQGVPVFISTIAFALWIYWLGGPFIALGIHNAPVASVLILICSFIVPIIYKGPKS